jgi:MinD superfamily P-loop ATPase
MRDFTWDYVWVDSSPGIGSNVMKSIEFVMW